MGDDFAFNVSRLPNPFTSGSYASSAPVTTPSRVAPAAGEKHADEAAYNIRSVKQGKQHRHEIYTGDRVVHDEVTKSPHPSAEMKSKRNNLNRHYMLAGLK